MFLWLDHRLAATAVTAVVTIIGGASVAQDCAPVDFMQLPLAEANLPPPQRALVLAYPDLQVSGDGMIIMTHRGARFDWPAPREVTPQQILRVPTLAEQFSYAYTLGPDLGPREVAFHDPGRVRVEAFFRALWFEDEAAARQTLQRVSFVPIADTGVTVTTMRGVDCQLGAVVAALAERRDDLGRYFETPGGGFNWRVIAGTSRLSAHSYGIAVDLNPRYGGYWRWSGAAEGDAADFTPQMPTEIVEAFERFGFIWGGKWHHFDAMHFEYRPELILHARILEEDPP